MARRLDEYKSMRFSDGHLHDQLVLALSLFLILCSCCAVWLVCNIIIIIIIVIDHMRSAPRSVLIIASIVRSNLMIRTARSCPAVAAACCVV